MSEVLLGVIIAGVMSIVGNLLLFALQWLIQAKKERREEKKTRDNYLDEFRMNLRLKQNELLSNASYITNINDFEGDRYLKFLDAQIYLESYYLHNNGEFGVYLRVRMGIKKLGELVVNYINESGLKNKKSLRSQIDDCIKYLQAYFNKIAEGFNLGIENITEYCFCLYDDEFLKRIEERLKF